MTSIPSDSELLHSGDRSCARTGEAKERVRGENWSNEIVCIRQRASWDCGLACVCMICIARCAHSTGSEAVVEARVLDKLHELVGTSSIWSIDLCFLLNALGFHWKYYTAHVGIVDSHGKMPFYSELGHDRIRILRRFQELSSSKLHIGASKSAHEVVAPSKILEQSSMQPSTEPLIAQPSAALTSSEYPSAKDGYEQIENIRQAVLSLDDIVDLLNSREIGAVIMLVDLRFLVFEGESMLEITKKRLIGSYAGHYILLLRFDNEKGFEYIDPASCDTRPKWTEASTLDKARKAEGTDEDVIVVQNATSFSEQYDRMIQETSPRQAGISKQHASVCIQF